jgi:hypothetical protein
MRTTLFILTILITLLCPSCERNQLPPSPYHNWPIPQEALDYGYFKVGTYWVYEDSASHNLDSIYVSTSYSSNIIIPEANNGGYYGLYGEFEVDMKNGTQSALYMNWANMTYSPGVLSTNPGGGIICTINRGENNLSGVGGSDFYLITPPSTYSNAWLHYSNMDSVMVLTDHASYYYESILFNQVVQVYYSKGASTYKYSRANIYLKKNIGIVKKQLLDSHEVWNLKRYHIVQ